MKIHRIWKCLVVSMILLALVLCFGTTAFAYGTIDTDQESSLTVYFGKDGNGFPGVEFQVYRVADVSDDAQFTLSGSFAEYPVVVNGLDSSGWRTLAQTLGAYVARESLKPFRKAETGDDGRAVFDQMDTGLYLVTGVTARGVTPTPRNRFWSACPRRTMSQVSGFMILLLPASMTAAIIRQAVTRIPLTGKY